MENLTIDDIKVKLLSKISLEGGNVLHAIKEKDPEFLGFGEVYFSIIKKNYIKAWKRHKYMTMNLIVPRGHVRFIFCVDKKKPFLEIFSGYSEYKLITVPPNVWFGFQGVSDEDSLIMNLSNIAHDPDEVDRLERDVLIYEW